MDLPLTVQVTGKGRDRRPIHCRGLYRLARSFRIEICWTPMGEDLLGVMEGLLIGHWLLKLFSFSGSTAQSSKLSEARAQVHNELNYDLQPLPSFSSLDFSFQLELRNF